jgi:hypothetical protein
MAVFLSRKLKVILETFSGTLSGKWAFFTKFKEGNRMSNLP